MNKQERMTEIIKETVANTNSIVNDSINSKEEMKRL